MQSEIVRLEKLENFARNQIVFELLIIGKVIKSNNETMRNAIFFILCALQIARWSYLLYQFLQSIFICIVK